MGLAVPATSAAVMMSVPRERSGMASATMNALRQAGMTLGIALLGTLMSARSLTLLTTSLEAAGVADARATAAAAVSRHEVTAASGMDTSTFNTLLSQAFAGGFHVAMVYAGLLGLMAAALLVAVRSRVPSDQR